MTRIAWLAAVVLATTSTLASAHTNKARFEEQNDAIEAGRMDGSITWREGLKLRKQQAEIARKRAELLADGHLTRKERRELHKMQNSADAAIEHEASDGWRRLWWLPRVGK